LSGYQKLLICPSQHQAVCILHLIDQSSGFSTTLIAKDLPTDGGPINPVKIARGSASPSKVRRRARLPIAPEQAVKMEPATCSPATKQVGVAIERIYTYNFGK
jgi:hypothetical protein